MKYFLGCLIVLIILACFFIFGENQYIEERGMQEGAVIQKEKVSVAGKIDKSNNGKESDIVNNTSYSDEEYYIAGKEHMKNYVVGINDDDYKVYDLETLLSLVEGGDVKAMKVAALKMMDKSEKAESSKESLKYHERYIELLEEAVVYGDRESFGLLKAKYVDGSPLLMDSASEEEKTRAMVDALAYYEFLGLRGDFGGKYYGQKFFFKSFMPEKTSLSSGEVRDVKKRSKDIYDYYESQRLDLGLGPFDNSIPESFQGHLQDLKAEYLQEMGDLAVE